jgi:hypothetical protein
LAGGLVCGPLKNQTQNRLEGGERGAGFRRVLEGEDSWVGFEGAWPGLACPEAE